MHIYNEFERYAIDLYTNGRRERYGSKMIVERMRWDTQFKEMSEDFKINNNVTSYLARLVMLERPLLDGMFQMRAPKELQDTA